MNIAYAVSLAISAAICLTVALVAFHRRTAPGASGLLLYMASCTIWAGTYAIRWSTSEITAQLFWLDATYFGVVQLSTAFLIFALQFTARPHLLTRRNLMLLGVVPIFTLVMLWTDKWHGLFFGGIPRTTGSIFNGGPVFWLFVIYAYSLIFIAIGIFFRALLHSSGLYRLQVSAALFAGCLPVVGNILSLIGFIPFPNLDLTPFIFMASGLIFAYSLYGFRMMDIVPVARHKLVDEMMDGIIVLDANQRIVDINPAAQGLIGISNNVIGRAFEDISKTHLRMDQLRDPGVSSLTELCVSENPPRNIELQILPLFDTRQRLSGHLLILHDVTERKRAEEQLRESEEKFRSLLESQEGNIMLLDFDGVHHYVNQVSVGSINGSYTTQDIIGKRLHDLYPASVADWQLEQTQRVFTTGQGLSGDFKVCMENQVSWWHLNLQPMRNASGQITQVMVNSLNITERKQMEDALRESESRFRGYFELPLGGRAITSPTKGWLDVNSELCDMLGYTKAELMQMTWAELTHPDDIAIDMAQFNRVMAGEINGYTIGKRFIHKSGRSVHTHLAVQCMRHPDQTVDYFMALLLDITKLKQAEEEIKMLNATLEQRVEERTFELVHANRVKDEFLASMSHELRTPLNAISGYSQLLLEGLHGSINERQQRDLGIVRSSCDHLLGLITDILDVSKIESGQFTLHLESVDVSDVCKASMEFVNQFAEQKNIEMDYSTSEDEPVILADAKRLKQILVNLLNNAVKFTPEKGRIKLEVRTDVSAGLMRFSVTDTGIGISAEDLPKLFKPFVQLDGSLSRQYQGTGLGLSLVKRLVEIQGGSVDVQSEAGVGSCFTFVLPWQDVSTDNKGRDLIVADDQKGRLMTTPHAKVLIADDNEVNVMVVRDYLESFGYQVSVAFDGAEVLSKVEQEIPDVILMDIQMPHVNGVELTRRLRTDPRFATVPIIALTALALPGDRERCFEAGMNEYMSKPVSLKEVRTIVERFLIRA